MATPPVYVTTDPRTGVRTFSDRPPEHPRDMRAVNIPGVGHGPGHRFDTINDAAIDALAYARKRPMQGVEYGGWIVRAPGGGYTYTFVDPRGGANGEHTTPSSVRFGAPPQGTVGAYHTHPGRNERLVDYNGSLERFSGEDAEFARWMRRNGILPGTLYLSPPSGRVRALISNDGREASITIRGSRLPTEGASLE